ncbi:MAG: swr1 complex component, partial [Thelocarpon superellum]
MRGARDRTSAATPKQSLDTVNHSKPDASPRSSPTPQPTGSPAAPNGTPHASADGQVNGVLADKPNDMHGDLDPDREDGRASSKRRKLSGVGASAASASASASVSAIRPISPPWKRIVVEGPTSFVEGGRRKSSRTNAVPLELQPQSDKRQTRSAQQRTPTSKSRYGGAFITPSQTPKSPSTKITRGLTRSVSMGRPPANHTAGKTLPRHPPAAADPPAKKSPAKSSSLKHRASAPTMRGASKAASRALPPRSPQRTRRSARTSDLAATRREATAPHHETPEGTDEPSSIWSSPEPEELPPNAKTPRLKFKVKMPTVPIQHPLHVVPPRLFPSFRDWLEHDDPLSGEDTRRMTNEDAEREARMRTRILDASRPGGALSEEKCAVYAIPAQEEPDRQYAHHDHLVSQVLYFRKLLGNERRLHLGAAKRLAYAAAAEWRKRQPKTEDDRLNEQYNANRAHYRLVRKSLQVKWDMIATEVARRRRERWEEEQQALGKQALNQMLEKSTHLLDARRARRSSELVSDDESGAGDLSHADASADEPEDESDKSDEGGGDDDDDDDESNMSTSEAGSEEPPGPLGVDDDEGLTVDQLRRKYARLPDTVHASIDQDDDEPELDDDTSMLFGQDSEVEITDTAAPGEDIVEAEIEEVDDALLDDSDASTDMDDDMGDSDEGGEGSSEEEDEVDDEVASEDDQAPPGLLGFFSKRELLVEEPSEKGIDDVIEDASPLAPDPSKRQVVPDASSIPTPPLGDVTSGTRGTPDEHPPPPNEDVIQHLPSRHASPGTNTTAKPSEIDASSVEMHAGSQHPS